MYVFNNRRTYIDTICVCMGSVYVVSLKCRISCVCVSSPIVHIYVYVYLQYVHMEMYACNICCIFPACVCVCVCVCVPSAVPWASRSPPLGKDLRLGRTWDAWTQDQHVVNNTLIGDARCQAQKTVWIFSKALALCKEASCFISVPERTQIHTGEFGPLTSDG